MGRLKGADVTQLLLQSNPRLFRPPISHPLLLFLFLGKQKASTLLVIPQGRLRQRKATAALRLTASEHPQPPDISSSEKGRSPLREFRDSGREGSSFSVKTNRPASQNPNNVCAFSREDLQKGRNKCTPTERGVVGNIT